MKKSNFPLVSVVVIGRNEGRRLVDCIQSIKASDYPCLEVIYVDSASQDGSPEAATNLGAKVIRLAPSRPSAALGRNAGWHAAQGEYILFLDGDTLLHPEFIGRAMHSMADAGIAVVWGHRRESRPEQSLYVRVLDLDWIYPPGESLFCGGDALMRRTVLQQTGGFDGSLIAGEEPELCRRIRQLGYRILHIDEPMTRHDLAVQSFSAYWKRAFRAGHAYAELATRFRHTDDPLWLADSRRNGLRVGVLLSGLVIFLLANPSLKLGLLAAVISMLLRSAQRSRWKSPVWQTRMWYALHSHFQQIPIACGQMSFWINRLRGQRKALIEYKTS